MANLSQEAINALLQGEADSGVSAAEAQAVQDQSGPAQAGELEAKIDTLDKSAQYLTPRQIDTIGEIGNICMGTSATTMYTLLGRRVTITTPKVQVFTSAEVLSLYSSPFVIVEVAYVGGYIDKNLLILKEYDTALITDLLMGGEGKVDADNIELTELHLSAISEIMNQMIGSSATALSNILGAPVNITPPRSQWVAENTDVSEFLDHSELIIKVSFEMEIEGLLRSTLLQLMSLETGVALSKTLSEPHPEVRAETAANSAPPSQQPLSPESEARVRELYEAAAGQASQPYTPPPSYQPPAPPPQGYAPTPTVSVKPAEYPSFDGAPSVKGGQSLIENKDLSLISDIPLQVTVELGKTKKSINDVLELGVGSVVVLDRMAGEMVDIVVNGKLIARGEVVVIDDNYGVRIADITRSNNGHL